MAPRGESCRVGSDDGAAERVVRRATLNSQVGNRIKIGSDEHYVFMEVQPSPLILKNLRNTPCESKFQFTQSRPNHVRAVGIQMVFILRSGSLLVHWPIAHADQRQFKTLSQIVSRQHFSVGKTIPGGSQPIVIRTFPRACPASTCRRASTPSLNL